MPPTARPLLIRNARVLTFGSRAGLRGGTMMEDLAALPDADVLIEGRTIRAVGRALPAPPGAIATDAGGRVLMPGFIDAHTHACFAGDRLDEWDQKRRGVPYLEILARGGGIMSTVRAVRAASHAQLLDLLRPRLQAMLALGSTTIEVKSGYGLSTNDELKMLRVIRDAVDGFPGTIVPTALLGHALDPDVPRDRFVKSTILETLLAVTAEFPGIAIDAYCEQGAWSLPESLSLFDAAAAAGHPLRVHTDQFHVLGMLQAAIERADPAEPARGRFVSVDHLEATPDADLQLLARTGLPGVLLPCAGFHTDGRYANGRTLVEAGGAAVVATNFNPGSAPCLSMPMALALAVRHNGLSPHQALTAATSNAAAVLGLSDRGRIAPGLRADLILLHGKDEREVTYAFGANPAACVLAGGVPIAGSLP